MVAQRMAERLDFIKLKPRRVLDASAWLGGSEAALRGAYPQAELLWHADDEALATRARAVLERPWWQFWGRAGLPRWLDGPPAGVELLWSNLQLHAAADLPRLLKRWHGSLEVGGFVMFSCLGPDSFVELRPLFAAAGWGRSAPDWWDMHDLGDLMAQAGFVDPVMDQERLRLTWADGEALLRDLRALGGNLAPTRFAGLRTPRWRRQLLEGLEGLRGTDGRLGLSLELVYGHAFKGAPRHAVAAETAVSLDAMRESLRAARRNEGKA
jgi:malonyl-CoA O-methyltransferase